MSPDIVLNDLAGLCHWDAFQRGWWDHPNRSDRIFLASKIALIHSEMSEALEALRTNHNDTHLPHRSGIEVELADALIRILDLAGSMELDIGGAVMEKMEYNRQRSDHSTEARNLPGGKKF